VDRGDVDDPAAAALRDHSPCGGLRDQKRSHEVDGEDLPQRLDRVIDERAGLFDAGVVHDDVQAAKVRDGCIDQAVHLFGLRHIGLDRAHATAEGGDGCLRLPNHARIADVIDDDGSAFAREGHRDRLTNARPGPGDDGNFVAQPHDSSPRAPRGRRTELLGSAPFGPQGRLYVPDATGPSPMHVGRFASP
jgi:hypothetical protein